MDPFPRTRSRKGRRATGAAASPPPALLPWGRKRKRTRAVSVGRVATPPAVFAPAPAEEEARALAPAEEAWESSPEDPTGVDTPEMWEATVHQLKVGDMVMCRRRGGNLHPAKILQIRPVPSAGDGEEYEYYVHYSEFNRRNDEWVKLAQLYLGRDVEAAADKEASLKTRRQKRKFAQEHEEDHGEMDAAALRVHEECTKVKNVTEIELGRYVIDTWYFSPFPSEYDDVERLFFCEFCLNFFKRKERLQRHLMKCDLKHPPGNEIYRSGNLSLFEVDGRRNRVYGKNLCLLAKLFLDHKSLEFDVELFLFYILCECDDRGCHIAAYFSKPKHSEENYNLSCILTSPPHQKKGYGKFLIAFSYELSKKEGKIGTPERPLSDLGMISYKHYWTRVLLDIVKKRKGNISIQQLSDMTAIMPQDILRTLQDLELVKYRKGQHSMCTDAEVLDEHLKAAGSAGLEVDVSKLRWKPYEGWD